MLFSMHPFSCDLDLVSENVTIARSDILNSFQEDLQNLDMTVAIQLKLCSTTDASSVPQIVV